jgi:hypothetical protein
MSRRGVAVVWNGRTRRLRLPWRLLGWVGALLATSLVVATAVDAAVARPVAAVLALVTPGRPAGEVAVAARNVVLVASQATVAVGSVYLAGRLLDRRRFRDFGFRFDRSWWLDLGFGLALGAALMTGVFLVELLAGWIAITGRFYVAQPAFSFPHWIALSLATYASVGVYEELVARGYLLKNLAEGLTWVDRLDATGAAAVATLASSLAFGAGHLANPNASLASTAGVTLAAVMLAAGYVVTGELAIPVGLHVTWNLFQGTVYGLPVSGTTHGLSVVAVEQGGPPLMTGGSFGPEAGLLGAAAAVVGTGAVLAWCRWRRGAVGVDPSLVTPELRHGPVDDGGVARTSAREADAGDGADDG